MDLSQLIRSRHQEVRMPSRQMPSWSDAENDEIPERRHSSSVRPMDLAGRMHSVLSHARRNARFAAKRELRMAVDRVVTKARQLEVDDEELVSWLVTALHRQPTRREADDYGFCHRGRSSSNYADGPSERRLVGMHTTTVQAGGHRGTFALPVQVCLSGFSFNLNFWAWVWMFRSCLFRLFIIDA